MAEDQSVSKIQLQIDAEVKNLAKLEAVQTQLERVASAYLQLVKAAKLGKAAIEQAGTRGTGKGDIYNNSGLTKARESMASARSELGKFNDVAKNIGSSFKGSPLEKLGQGLADDLGKVNKALASGDKGAIKQLRDMSGAISGHLQSAATGAATFQTRAAAARQEELTSTQALDKLVQKADASADSQAKSSASRAQSEKSTTESVQDRQAAQARIAKDSVVAQKATEGAAKATAKIATQPVTANSALATAAKVAAPVAGAKPVATAATGETAAALQARLSGGLRSLLGQASTMPTGAAVRPTLRELQGTQLPIVSRTGAGAPPGGGDAGSPKALQALASSAAKASAALDKLASSVGSSVGKATGVAGAAGPASMQQLRRMAIEDPAGTAQYHKTLRQLEAMSNPKYAAATKMQAAGQVTYSRSVAQTGEAAAGASKQMAGMAKSQDAILGQVKNVFSMAFGYQAIHAVASQLNQIFAHLKGGIIQYNSMVEQATVGFTTLFGNQAKNVFAMGDALKVVGDQAETIKNVLAADVSLARVKIDYIAMGYTSANEAATGMITTIRNFANITPFRFPELQDAALRMRAFGFAMSEVLTQDKKTKEFSGGIVAVGNAVSALGGGADAFRRITYALGQMKQAGRVYQNDMMQLANAGIGGYRYIATALSKEISTNADGTKKKMSASQQDLFNKLQTNAIETVRRLTTNGQISGEAAARAILDGLQRDFGGGMEAQAKTFMGAFSTVADMSQSLVADAFKPLYDSISAATYEFGMFLQRDDVRTRAQQLGEIVKQLTERLTYMGKLVVNVISASFQDFSNAIAKVSDNTSALGAIGQSVFGGFFKGIAALTEIMQNDYIRQLSIALGLMKLMFMFGASNPLLTSIMAVVTAVGVLSEAYKTNFMGFQTAVNDLVHIFSSLVRDIQTQIIPAFAELGALVAEIVYGTIIVAFRMIEPLIQIVVRALNVFLRTLQYFKIPLAGLAIAFAGAFVFGKIVAGFNLISRSISALLLKLDILAQKSRIAGQGLMYVGYGRPGFNSAINYAGDTPGASSRIVTGGGLVSGFANKAGAASIAGMGLGLGLEAMGADQQITQTVMNVSSALMGFSALKMIIPPGSGEALGKGLKAVASGLSSLIATNLPALTGALASLKTALAGTGIAAFFSGIAVAFRGLASGVASFFTSFAGFMGLLKGIAAFGGAGIFPMFDENVPGSLTAPGGPLDFKGDSRAADEKARTSAQSTYDKYGKGKLSEQSNLIMTQYALPRINKDRDMNALFKDALAGKETNSLYTAKQLRDAYYEYLGLVRKGVEQGRFANDGLGKGAGLVKKTTDAMKLLVDSQKQVNGNADYLNWALGVAKAKLQSATALLQQLAEGALQKILNPELLTNPYTGLAEAGRSMEEIMQIEQDMGFAQYENAQGITRSFDEYKDVLNAILPITDADLVNGQLSLQAVKARLKIDKERRVEQEHLRAIAEADYDLGLAQLQMYDESVDPLERGVQMRQAQLKYNKDINDLQQQGLGILVDEAAASDQMRVATAATKRRLDEFKQGQALILNEMKLSFEDYNKDVADILANPKWSAAQKENKIKTRLDELYKELEDKFGITGVMLDDQLTTLNGIIDGTVARLGSPALPHVDWGNTLSERLEQGGFGVLKKYLKVTAVDVARLTAAAFAAANPEAGMQAAAIQNRDALVKLFKTRIGLWTSANGDQRTRLGISRYISDLQGSESYESIVSLVNLIDSKLQAVGLAKGGTARSGSLHLVGEQGPELFVPRSTGMVLNNSVSSALLGMLGGGGRGLAMAGAGNVTINVNNPVIRSDGDIRKLADQISKAQASQFRSQGGRLS